MKSFKKIALVLLLSLSFVAQSASFQHYLAYRRVSADFYDHTIDQSCRFNDDDSAELYRTNVASTDGKKETVSTWVKRCNLGTIQIIADGYFNSTNYNDMGFNANNKLWWTLYLGSSVINLVSTQVFRDVGSRYHLMFVKDTTEAVQADRVKVYCNGFEITAWDIRTCTLGLNATSGYIFNQAGIVTRVGRYTAGGLYFDGYLSEYHAIDGQALTPSSFGQFKNGIWIPKKYTGTYGNNGVYFDFADSADLGNDVSGNNNDFTSSGLTSDDQVEDSPTNNYPTLSPLNTPPAVTLTNGNLNIQYSGTWILSLSTMMFPNSGKWYFEYKVGADLVYIDVGVQKAQEGDNPITTSTTLGDDTTGWGMYSDGAQWHKMYNNVATVLTGDTPSDGDVMQIAVDMDAGKIWFGSNDTWLSSGNPAAGTNEAFSGLSSDLVPAVCIYQVVDTDTYINFGQLGFAHTPPTGFKALCSNNISKLSGTFNTYSACSTEDDYSSGTYTGNGNVDGTFIYLGYYPTDVCIDGDHYDETSSVIDVLSNGFKLRSLTKNTNSTSYTWEAWVHQDGKYSNAAPNVD